MSVDEPEITENLDREYSSAKVSDEEGYLSQEQKKEIWETRRDVREWSKKLFSESKMGGLGEEDALLLWRDRVVDYLMALQPLWQEESLPNTKELYNDVVLGYAEFRLPAEYQRFFEQDSVKSVMQQDAMIVGERPKPVQRFRLNGIQSVLDHETITATWDFKVRSLTGRPGIETIHHEETRPFPKDALMTAVRLSDQWRQQSGIGIEIKGRDHYSQEPGL